MIRTGSKEDNDRFFLYGDEDKENKAGDKLVLSLGPIKFSKLMLVVTLILSIILALGTLELVYPGIINRDLWLPSPLRTIIQSF